MENQGGGMALWGTHTNKFQIFVEGEFCTFKDMGAVFFGGGGGKMLASAFSKGVESMCETTRNSRAWWRS